MCRHSSEESHLAEYLYLMDSESRTTLLHLFVEQAFYVMDRRVALSDGDLYRELGRRMCSHQECDSTYRCDGAAVLFLKTMALLSHVYVEDARNQ